MSVSIKPEDVKVHRSIASIFNLSDDTGTHYLTSFALLGLGTSYSPSVRTSRRPRGRRPLPEQDDKGLKLASLTLSQPRGAMQSYAKSTQS